MDKATAKSALDMINKAHGLLMDSLRLVEEKCSDEEYKTFQSEMAQILGQLFFLVMEPIYREHPSLAGSDTPKQFLDAWRKDSGQSCP
jgi:hypothetical protein